MKATELRIGDLVEVDNQGTFKVDGISLESDTYLEPSITYSNESSEGDCVLMFDEDEEYVKPIPITEEKLLSSGLQRSLYNKDSGFSVYKRNFGIFEIRVDFENYEYFVYVERMPLPHIKSWHLFQNLIHALTGEELELKDKK